MGNHFCATAMKRALGALLIWSVMVAGGWAAGDPPNEDASAYAALLRQVKAFDHSVDFRALRLAYAETVAYNPYETHSALREQLYTAVRAERYDQALQVASAILDRNYLDIDTHFACVMLYRRTQKVDQAGYHRFVLQGLINSILSSGDGVSPETAFTVIALSEEYAILNLLGREVTKTATLGAGGHTVDRMETRDRKTGEIGVVFFNVDRPTGWLTKQMQKK